MVEGLVERWEKLMAANWAILKASAMVVWIERTTVGTTLGSDDGSAVGTVGTEVG